MKQLLLILMLACAACGCQATAERRAVQVLATTTRTADEVLNAYAAASVLGKTTPNQDQRISAINDRYLAAKQALRIAITAYKSGVTNAAPMKEATIALQSVTAEIATLPLP
jgi:hypothetical protein